MKLQILSMASLKDLMQGKAAAMFDLSLMRAIADCNDRPNDSTKRSVVFQVDLRPICDQQGFLDDIELRFKVHHTVPKQAMRSVRLMPRKERGQVVLTFNPDSEDARQNTLEFPETEESDVDETY